MDPETGLRCARFLAKLGVPGSFYILHTNPYYGNFYGNHFVRNPDMADWIRGLIVAGFEIGIHNDALHVFLEYGLNGIEALTKEIAWCRSNGAVIKGTVAHNSGPLYGAENYEIFSEKLLWKRKLHSANGNTIPLGSLSMSNLNLTYEGCFARPKKKINIEEAKIFFQDKQASSVRSKEWMKKYLLDNPACDWELDFQFWLTGKDTWIIAGKKGNRELFEWEVGIVKTIEILKNLPLGSRTSIVLHPAYVRS